MDTTNPQTTEPHVPPASDTAPPMPINPPPQPPQNNFGNKFSSLPNKKVIATIFGFLLLTTSVGVGVYLSQQRQRTGVSAALVNLSLTTSKANPAINENFVVAVSMNPQGMAVNGVDLRINFDSTKLTATSITPGSLLPTQLIPGSVSGNTAMIVLSAPIDASGPHPVTQSGLIAQIAFKAKAAGVSSVTFGTATTVSVSGQSSNFVGTKNPVTITVGGTGPTATGVRTNTPVPTGVRTATPIPTGVRTATPTGIRTATPTGLKTPTATPRATGTRTPTPRPTGSRTPTPRASGTRTPTPRGTATKTPTPHGTAVKTPTVKPTATGSTPSIKPGDINRDGQVTIVDVGILVDNYNKSPIPDPRADIDGNGSVNIVDVGILVDNYGK